MSNLIYCMPLFVSLFSIFFGFLDGSCSLGRARCWGGLDICGIRGCRHATFCEASLDNIDELYHHFLGGYSIHDAFGDVLLARTRCLYHLVDGAVAFLEEGVGKGIGDIIESLGFLVEELAMIVA